MDIIIAFIYFLFFFFLLIACKVKYKVFYNKTFLRILSFIIPSLSTSFFGQIFNALLSGNRCQNNYSYYNFEQKCKKGLLYFFEDIISIIAIIFLCSISLLVVSIYYIPIFVEGNNIIKKISSIPEQIFFACKIIIILLFYIEDYLKEKNQNINIYLMIVILVILSGINAYFSLIYKNSQNKKLLIINNIMSLLLFWGFFSLLIGIIFQYIDYSGIDYLFVIGSILIIIYQIYYNNRYQEEYWKNINYLYTNQERLSYILKIIDIVEKRNNSRKNRIILKILLEKVELYCIDPHCTIKQYMHQLKKGNDSSILLYRHCENLFKKSISKNKNDITAKIYFIIFLMTKLNKRKNALILLKKLEDRQLILFQDLFNIYHVKKLIEELSNDFDKVEDKFYNIKMRNLVQYKKYIKDFKNMLFKISSLYLKFWTLLLNSHRKIENIENLNNLGKEIKDLVQIINDSFKRIYNFRNDAKIIRLYTKFLKNVLVDKKECEEYIKKVRSISLENKNFNREDDYASYNINKLKETDETPWILVSASDKSYGKIINFSLGICPIIGYKKREIIGQNINILLPNIFHKSHDIMIQKLFYDSKYQFYENLSKKAEYKPEHIKKNVYCKNKSKYLVPFPFRAFFVQTEEGEHMFVMNIIKQQCFPHTKNSKKEELWCCVLTDRHFNIQTFTPNAFDYLGLNSSDIDSGLNITNCIVQFGNEIFNNVNDKENTMDNEVFNYSSDLYYETANKSFHNARTIKSENKLRRDLTKKEYSTPKIITWRYYHKKEDTKQNNAIKLYSKLSSERYEIKIINNDYNNNDKKLLLQIKECKIYNVIIGYKFLFKKIISKSNIINKDNINGQSDFMESDFSEISNYKDFNNNFNITPSATLKSNRNESTIKNDNSLNILNSEKPLINTKRRHSLGDFHQKINLNNFVSPFIIEANFLPKNKCNFIFDLKNMSYIYNNKFKNNNNNNNNNNNIIININNQKEDPLLKELIHEAKEKILLLKSFTQEMSRKQKNKELISNSGSENSSSYLTDSNGESSSFEKSSSQYMASMNDEALHKHYSSFMILQFHKSQGDIPNMNNNKNKTTKSNFDRKSIKDQPLFEKISNGLKEKAKIKYDFNYYEINLKNIRFLKYDFYKEMIVEVYQNDKLSKMKEILNQIKNNNRFINKDENYPSIDLEHIIPIRKIIPKKIEIPTGKKKIVESEKKLDFNKIIINKYKQQNYNLIEKEKKINEALSKKDKQHSIKKFLLISIICLFLLYGIGGVIFYAYLDEVSKDKENIKLICDSTKLKYFFNLAVYFIRELTLLNVRNITKIKNGEYTGYASYNKTNYISQLRDKVLELYSNIHSLNEMIVSTELPLTNNTTYYLNGKEFFIKAKINDSQLTCFRTGLSNAIITLDAYLYNLAELSMTIGQNHEDVYPFIHNQLNNVGELINIQIELFMNELKIRKNKNKKKFIISHCIVFVILFFIFIIISKAYSLVLEDKANYFYIFYGIKIEVIRNLISNCEYFLQKLKEDQRISNDEKEDGRIEEIDDESSLLNPKINIVLKSVVTNNESNYNILSPNKRKGSVNGHFPNQNDKKENFNDKNTIFIFNLCFIIFCLLILAYLCIIFSNYFSFAQLISEYALYINHLQNYHIRIIEILNGYREFLFDQNSVVNGMNTNDFINNKMNEILMTKFNDNIVFNKYRKKISGFLEIFANFKSQTLCSRRNNDYFHSEEECNLHMQGIATFGHSVLLTSFTEQIRIYKNIINQLLTNNVIVGNLTLYGSQDWDEEKIINDIKNSNNSLINFRLFLFNNNSYHKDLNILFINTIYPYIKTEREITFDSINKSIENKNITYIIYFSSFLIIITFLFILYWIPMINNMSLTIYKSKRMLSIIPLHILVSQANINNLLNLDNINKYKSNNVEAS